MRKLTLKDRKLFNKYLNFSSHELAVFSFANIYIWRSLYDIQWLMIESSLCIFFRDKIGCFMYLPPLAVKKQLKVIKESFAVMDKINKNKDISRIENIQEDDLGYYRSLGYSVRDKYPDYLCLQNDLAHFTGNKFKSQRASCNYFIKHYNHDAREFKLADRAKCSELFNSWIEGRKAQSNDDIYCGMLEDNRKVIKNTLANYRQLNLEGIIVRVNKQIKAFSFGYRLNNDIFCIFYEVTDLSIKGLAQFIFRKFSQKLKNYKYINIMDDSGIDNLQKTKLSYKPIRLIPAYIVTRAV